MQLFLRKYRLTLDTDSETALAGGLAGPPQNSGLLITDLDIRFNIIKSSDSKQNKAEISIFNLSRESRESIFKDAPIVLDVGYGDGTFDTLISGNVINFTHKNAGTDIETKLFVGDGYIPIREGYTNRSFSSGTALTSVFNTIFTEDMELPEAVFGVSEDTISKRVGITRQLTKDRAFSGQTVDVLDDLARSNNLDWSIRDGVPTVIPINGSTKESVVLLSEQSGMIGSPERIVVGTNKKNKDKAKDSGYRIQSLINPKINVGNKIKVVSREVTDVLKVTKITCKGQYESVQWDCVIEAIGIQETDDSTE